MAKVGRPWKGEAKKDLALQTRISKITSDKLWECAGMLRISRTEVLERGIDLVYMELMKDGLPQ